MVAAVSKLMRNQDLIAIARKRRVVTAFRDTLGVPGRMSVRLQPNHPTDDPRAIAVSILDGLMYGAGDAVIGINPASDSMPRPCGGSSPGWTSTTRAIWRSYREKPHLPGRRSCRKQSVKRRLAPLSHSIRGLSHSIRGSSHSVRGWSHFIRGLRHLIRG